jgi:hypothetical protein
MTVRTDGTVETVRPSTGSPVPDRSFKYEAAKRRFGTRSHETRPSLLGGEGQ